jgi:hypothetical protein
LKDFRQQERGYQRRAAAFPPAWALDQEGNPSALPAGSWRLTVPVIVQLVGLDHDPFPLTLTLSLRLIFLHFCTNGRQ